MGCVNRLIIGVLFACCVYSNSLGYRVGCSNLPSQYNQEHQPYCHVLDVEGPAINACLFGIFDGLGKNWVTQSCGNFIFTTFCEELRLSFQKKEHRTIGNSFIGAYSAAQKKLSAVDEFGDFYVMATTCFLNAGTLSLAHVGTNSCFLSKNGNAIPLCVPHVPIEGSGEYVRIKINHGSCVDGLIVDPEGHILAPASRILSSPNKQRCGIVSVPDLYEYHLAQNDTFVVLATNVFWRVMVPQEVCMDIDQSIARGDNLDALCARLCAAARERGCLDALSMMVIAFEPKDRVRSPGCSF